MSKWIDVCSKLPPVNTVVIGMATTPDFAGKAFPAMVGFDATRGWVTWPTLELCYVFYWKRITSPGGHTFKIFEEKEPETNLNIIHTYGEKDAENTVDDNSSNGNGGVQDGVHSSVSGADRQTT